MSLDEESLDKPMDLHLNELAGDVCMDCYDHFQASLFLPMFRKKEKSRTVVQSVILNLGGRGRRTASSMPV